MFSVSNFILFFKSTQDSQHPLSTGAQRGLERHQCSSVGFASGCWVARWGSSASELSLEVQESSFLFLDFVCFIISSIAFLNLLKWIYGIIFPFNIHWYLDGESTWVLMDPTWPWGALPAVLCCFLVFCFTIFILICKWH